MKILAMSKKKYEVRITQVSPTLHGELINISKNLGERLTTLLKPELRKFVESYPEKMRKPPLDY